MCQIQFLPIHTCGAHQCYNTHTHQYREKKEASGGFHTYVTDFISGPFPKPHLLYLFPL